MHLKYLKITLITLLICYSLLNGQVFKVEAAPQIAPHAAGELLVKLINSDKIYKFKFSDQEDLTNLIEFYNSSPQVEYVAPNYLYQAVLEPLDTYYTQQIYLTQIKAHQAWNITTGRNKVVF